MQIWLQSRGLPLRPIYSHMHPTTILSSSLPSAVSLSLPPYFSSSSPRLSSRSTLRYGFFFLFVLFLFLLFRFLLIACFSNRFSHTLPSRRISTQPASFSPLKLRSRLLSYRAKAVLGGWHEDKSTSLSFAALFVTYFFLFALFRYSSLRSLPFTASRPRRIFLPPRSPTSL